MEYEFSKSGNLYAITVLEEFFEYYGPDQALHYTERLIYFSLHHKYYRDSEPYAMVFHAEWLRKVVSAVFVLQNSFLYSDAFCVPAVNGFPDLGRKEDFVSDIPSQEWKCLPRHITAKQYINPMKALTKLTGYKSEAEWMKAIDELLEYSLCKASIDECYPPYNILKIRLILLQVIEACHLLRVRYLIFKQLKKQQPSSAAL